MAETIAKRVLKINFSGKELLESRIFDTTIEEVAKKSGIYEPKRTYGPMTIITGEHELLPVIESELVTMNPNEKKTVKLSIKDAFGERKANLVRVVPLKTFIDQKIKPIPGLVITVGNAFGKVQSVSGGRVRVDFNNFLAGREIEYELQVLEEIKDKKLIAETLFTKYYSFVPNAKKTVTADSLTVELGKDTLKNLEQINTSIIRLGKDLGVTVIFKESPEVTEKEKKADAVKQSDVALRKEVNEMDGQTPEAIKNEIPVKSINQVAKDLKSFKKSTATTTVNKDSATSIQRPVKK